MAKILPGLAVHKISGTIGGTTFQNWRGILVARSKPTPTNVNTPRQTIIRSLMTLLSRAWRDELTKGLRTAWNQHAKTFPWLDVFGREVKMSGENLYIKQNMVLLDHGLTRVDQPAPGIVPPELIDAVFVLHPEGFQISVPELPSAIVTAQTPFLDIWIAGGYESATYDAGPPVDVNIVGYGLPAGRKHQKSDFRHAVYATEIEEQITPDVQNIGVGLPPPVGVTRNMVVSIRRYNKFGNFSAPRIFEGIITSA